MNPKIAQLHPYPFEKLATLFADLTPPAHLAPIMLSIGEPKHASPHFVNETLIAELKHLSTYPTTKGLISLREAISQWLTQRYHLKSIDANTQILPVNGTREAIFSLVQAVINPADKPYVIMPNPFYQIYEGAALLAGATPYFVNCTAENNYLGDYDSIPASIWQKTQLVFICSPGNPTGAVMPAAQMQKLIELSDQYGFILAADECYSELYYTTPPIGLLQVCADMGRHDYKHCVVFHSLSKRSNLPGLRSGFVAGDANILMPYLTYRTYHGSAMPVQHQLASAMAWQDEKHVVDNRALYLDKFTTCINLLNPYLPVVLPSGGFYFWLAVDNDEHFARRLYAEQNVTVLPGRYLSRDHADINPGENHVRIALVAHKDSCIEACQRILQVVT